VIPGQEPAVKILECMKNLSFATFFLSAVFFTLEYLLRVVKC
jgi:hypothetical protein